MKALMTLSLAFFVQSSCWAVEEAPSLAPFRTMTADKPASQLLHLERSLLQKQEERDKGALNPEAYQAFIVGFREELSSVIARLPSTPANKGLHAQILARLSERDRGQAMANLEQSLELEPDNPSLLVSKGGILYESGDYPGSAALAQQAWEASGRKDERAWHLLKMSEGRIAAGGSGGPGPALKPAADFVSTDWAIRPNDDINPQAMGLIRQAIDARGEGSMSATWGFAQAAMNADPTSTAVQRFYGAVRAEQSQQADTKSFIEKAVLANHEGRGEEAIHWAQKAYDRSPGDDTYEILQKVRLKAAASGTKNLPSEGKKPIGGGPLLPALLLAGGALGAVGVYGVAKSKTSKESEEGLDPEPKVSPGQARRNYLNSAVLIGTPIVIVGLVYGGPIAWRALAPAATSAWQSLQGSAQKVATSEAGALFPEERLLAQRAASAGIRITNTRRNIDAASFFDGTRYSANVLAKMEKTDYHAFPELVKNYATSGETMSLRGGDGITRAMLRISGSYNGRDGFFEFIKESDGTITHRLFRPSP